MDKPQFEQAAELQKAGRFADAAEVYTTLAQERLTGNVAINLGICLNESGQRERASHFLGLAARHEPRNTTFRRLLASALAEAGRFDEAEAELRAVLEIAPDDGLAQLALANVYLTSGRYAQGWPLLAARTKHHAAVVPAVNLQFPEWRGEPLAGRSILIWVEQGFGDKIQMARFVNLLKARGAGRITLGCNPELKHLFSTLRGADHLIPIGRGQTTHVETHDFWSRYFSLPEHLGITLDTLPTEPYLAAPLDARDRWRGFRPGAGFRGAARPGARIGLAWQASPTGFNAANKGLSQADAARLIDRGALSLSPEDTGAKDFADTAAIIEGLDLVISIDTSVAHLAGAMGKRCWTLLPFVHCDWRWLQGRSDSPWYPSLRLYRQVRARDWTPTLDQLLADLAADDLAPLAGASA